MILHHSSEPSSAWKPTVALLLGATSWGILWYPFRVIEAGGLAAPVATLVAYAVALLIGGLLFRRAWAVLGRTESPGDTNIAAFHQKVVSPE